MITRSELVSFLQNYFQPFEEIFKTREMLVNGLQISGVEEITKVGLGVSANLEFFQKAKTAGCNFLIVHHGLSFASAAGKGNRFPLYQEERLRFLFQNGMSLSGYHGMLDHHPEIGNNASVIRRLGGAVTGNIFDKWGWFGRFPEPRSLSEIIKQCENIYSHPGRVVGVKKDKVTVFAVVSGSGAIDYHSPAIMNEFIDNGIELQIVGDMRESHPAIAKELGMTIAAFGHYNTETIGIINLGEVLKQNFPGLGVEFIDVPNDL